MYLQEMNNTYPHIPPYNHQRMYGIPFSPIMYPPPNGLIGNSLPIHGYAQPHHFRMGYAFDERFGLQGMPPENVQTETDDRQFESDEEYDGSTEELVRAETDQTSRQAKSAAIDIRPTKPWKRSIQNNGELQDPGQRSRNLGKVAINLDTNLSSSTDELLKLAGGGPLQKLRVTLPSYEDSPPSTPETLQLRKVNRKDAEVSVDNATPLPVVDDIREDYNHAIQGFQHLTVTQPPILPLAQPMLGPQSSIGSGPLPQSPIGILQQSPMGPSPLAPTPIGSLLDGQTPILAAVRPQSQPICRYFASGFCSQGDRCNFAHIEHGFNNNGTTIVHKTRFKNRVPIPASQYINLKLEDCIGEIAPMCLDQHGCRYLQRQLDTGEPKVIKVIFDEVIDHIVNLMSDPFGNYLCQKLIEHCSEEQRIEIVKGVTGDIVHISKNMHGTRAVQKLIEHLSSPEENKLVRKALKGSVVGLIQDLNGNHVIQKCLHKMEPNDNQFIYDAVAQHCVQVSTHRHGCCVMQRCIDHATYQQKLQLVKEIKVAALSLVQDAFGNYVVQYALDLDIPNLATELIIELQTKLLYLARQKFSSNVVEKCLKVGNCLCVTRVLRELMDEEPDPEVSNPTPSPHPDVIQQNLIELLQDSYGNYVIQTCLSEGAVKATKEYLRMVNLLNPYVHQLRNAPYIKRIQNLLSLPTKDQSENGINAPTDAQPVVSMLSTNSNGAEVSNQQIQHPRGTRSLYFASNSQRFQRQ